MSDAYQDRLDYLYGRLDYERVGMPRGLAELGLGRMRRLMRRLGDPQRRLRIVHVAGTKGKGSTAAMMAAALTASGASTGLYTSPHLERLEERYQIDGRPIEADELVGLVDEVRDKVEAMEADEGPSRRFGATFFEITTAAALLHFARREVGAVVLEVGMGGRLDSTNIVRPLVAVVTSIALDHTRQLGDTLGAIATEKAGIFKRGVPAVSGVIEPEPRESVRRAAAARGCLLREIGLDFDYEERPPAGPLHGPTPSRARVRTWRTDWGELDVPLLGPHQAHNLAVALAGLDALAEVDATLAVGRDDAARGFATLEWPARVEVMGTHPWLVVDGAHNVASAEALAATLRAHFPDVPRVLVFGTTRDKDLPGQLRALLPLFGATVATRYEHNPRAVPPADVAAAAEAIDGRTALVIADPAEALESARRLAGPGGLVCVTGSLFLAAETRAILRGRAASPAGPAR